MRGIEVVAYVDDFLFIADSAEKVNDYLSTALELFQRLRVPVNTSKVTWATQMITFLGVELNSVTMSVAVPADRARNMLCDLGAFDDNVSRGNRCTGRQAATHMAWE